MSSVTLAYETQLRIRREGEERIRAQQDLTSWLDELKLSSNTPDANLSRVKGTMVETTTPPIVANFEDERRRGNEFFSRGKYQEAIECYTRCLLDKDAAMSPVVYSNRAIAYLKVKNWINAENDATSALKIDPKHSKAYQRRCVARLSLGKLRQAMMDGCAAEDCLDRKEDTKALNEIRALQQKVHRALVKAVKYAPRRRIPIETIQ